VLTHASGDSSKFAPMSSTVFTGESFLGEVMDAFSNREINNGEQQSLPVMAAANPSDEEFVATFKKISGPSPVVITLKLAKLCAAKKSFSAERLTLRKLKLSASKFSKYAQIGRDRRFDDPAVRRQLPAKAGYSILYALSLLDEEQWHRGFDGIITPRTTRAEVDALRTGIHTKKRARTRSESFFASVTIPKRATENDIADFRAALISLCEEKGFGAVFNAAETLTVSEGR
jgi:hypothetical protein